MNHIILDCPVCFDRYDQSSKCPRMLNCGHTFCHSCLERILQNSKLCSTCNKKITFNNVGDVPINYALKSILDDYQKTIEKSAIPEIGENSSLIEDGIPVNCIHVQIILSVWIVQN